MSPFGPNMWPDPTTIEVGLPLLNSALMRESILCFVHRPVCLSEVYVDNFPRFWVNMPLNVVTLWVGRRVDKFCKILVWRIRLHFKNEAL